MNENPEFSRGWLGPLALVLFLTACGEQSASPSSVQGQRETTSQATKFVSSPANHNSPQEIVQSFKRDLAACRDITRYRPEPSQEPKVDSKAPEHILDVAPFSGTPEASYIKANSDYVSIWVSYHHDPFAASRLLESVPLFCGPSFRRMEDIDRSPAPEEGWEIREHFLNLGIKDLETVLDIGPGGDSVRWDWMRDQLTLAERFYAKTRREQLLALSHRVAAKIRANSVDDNKTFDEMYGSQPDSSEALKVKSDIDKETASRTRFIRDLLDRLQNFSN